MSTDDQLARRLVDQVLAGDVQGAARALIDAAGLPRAAVTDRPTVTYSRWVCPTCDGTGRYGDARCHHCAGYGLTNDIEDPDVWPGLREAPRPPAVMRAPCVDCAFRPGSPEDEAAAGSYGTGPCPDVSAPFFCHHGLHRVDGDRGASYEATAYVGGMPLGAMVCASWWALLCDGELPGSRLAPFRDPGGADRAAAAPEQP